MAKMYGQVDQRNRYKSDRHHVCHITTVHPIYDTRIFHKECCLLFKAGYKVTLIAPHSQVQIVNGVKIIPLSPCINRISRMLIRTFKAFKIARKLKADLYHFHDPEFILWGIALKWLGFKVIYDIHEDAPKSLLSLGRNYLPDWSRPILCWMLEKLENNASRRFDALIAATPHIHDRFLTYNCRNEIVNNYPIIEELEARVPIRWDERDESIAYVGGISFSRGLKEMVIAMGILKKETNIRLKLAGKFVPESSQYEVDKYYGWDRVDFVGYLNREAIKDLLGKVYAGIVVVHPEPNYLDIQPIKLYEYMCAGLPVIASDLPGLRELIDRNKCGILVDPLDSKAIAKAIEYLANNSHEAKQMGLNGHKAVIKNYNWSVEFAKLLCLYKEIIAS